MYLKYLDSEEYVKATVRPRTLNTVKVESKEVNLSGFRLYLTASDRYPLDKGEYEAYTTLYQDCGDYHILSNDGSVYEEPEPVVPEELTEEEIAVLEVQEQKVALRRRIELLKERLSESDYKVIKAYEYFIVAKTTEYDMELLHEERQNIRDKINDLEAQLGALSNEEGAGNE